MPEVQRHGFDFENWVKENFFADFKSIYTQKWDIPAEANHLTKIPKEFRGLPVSIKTCKFGSPIGFGDALRQFKNEEIFLLIVGFWQQSGSYKNFVAVEGVKVTSDKWRNLFSPLNSDDLTLLDSTIKNIETHYSEARKSAKVIKNSDKFKQAKIILNPKIDSKTQRRLQCSLPFNIFWQDFVGKESYQKIDSELFGEKIPNPFLSSQRIFKPKLSAD
ncbi:hypothetical protein BH20ACI4_BH20ACI4_24650 [soil metagenome]